MSDAASGGVGLWSDGRITIVLARVTSCAWMRTSDEEDDDGNPIDDICVMGKAEYFNVWCSDDGTVFDADSVGGDWKAIGISFLRALSLYWETRA